MNTTLLTPYVHLERFASEQSSFYCAIRNSIEAASSRISPTLFYPATPQLLNRARSEEERALLDIAFGYRILYFFKVFPIQSLLAWKGACWCSSEKLDSFPYGPGPDDPSLSGKAIRHFFEKHESFLAWTSPPGKRLALADENRLTRHCLVLGMFETIVRKGLFNCHNLPLLNRRNPPIRDMSLIPDESLVLEMTRLTSRFSSDFWNEEIDIEGCLEERRRIPATSPLMTAR